MQRLNKKNKNYNKKYDIGKIIACSFAVVFVLSILLTIIIIVNDKESFGVKIGAIVFVSVGILFSASALLYSIRTPKYIIIDDIKFTSGNTTIKSKRYYTWVSRGTKLSKISFDEITLINSKDVFEKGVESYNNMRKNFGNMYNVIEDRIYEKVTYNKEVLITSLTEDNIRKAIKNARKVMVINGDSISISFAADRISETHVFDYKFDIYNINNGEATISEY